MKIIYHNLSNKAYNNILEDFNTVKKIGKKYNLFFPDMEIKIVSLSKNNIPKDIPRHNLETPDNIQPTSFKARCYWERKRQSFQIIKTEKYLWIIGGDEIGTIYGWGELLHCLTGVIWSGLKEEDIFFDKPKDLPQGPQKPLFAFRGRDGSPPPGGTIEEFLKLMRRNRWNLWRRNSAYFMKQPEEYRNSVIKECSKNYIHLTLGDHSMHYFLPEEEFSKHPEWFGMRNGKRVKKAIVEIPECPLLKGELLIQPCYSNPDLIEYLTDRMAAHIKEFPSVDIFALWPHDGVNNWCQCPECLKKTPYEHIYTLAMALLKKIPSNVTIELIAYSNLLNLPRHSLPFSDRTFTLFCPYLRDYKHRIYERGFPLLILGTNYPQPDRINPVDDREYGKLFLKWLKVWEKIGSIPGIFEYGPTYYDETRRSNMTRYLYFPDPKVRYDEIKWYRKRGVEVFYLCSPYINWPDGFLQWALSQNLFE